MKIQLLIGIKDSLVVVYESADEIAFRFDIIDLFGKCYVCPYNFPSIDSAKCTAISIVERMIADRKSKDLKE